MSRRGASAGLLPLLAIPVLVLFVGRVAITSRAEFAEAVASEGRGEARRAIVHHRRAARMFAPPFDRSADARAHLLRIGADAERAGDAETALAAYRAVRSAVLSSRSLLVFGRTDLRRADARIALLSVGLGPRRADGTDAEEAARMLDAEPRERAGLAVLASLAFFAFVAITHRLLVDHVASGASPSRRDLGVLAATFVGFAVAAYLV